MRIVYRLFFRSPVDRTCLRLFLDPPCSLHLQACQPRAWNRLFLDRLSYFLSDFFRDLFCCRVWVDCPVRTGPFPTACRLFDPMELYPSPSPLRDRRSTKAYRPWGDPLWFFRFLVGRPQVAPFSVDRPPAFQVLIVPHSTYHRSMIPAFLERFCLEHFEALVFLFCPWNSVRIVPYLSTSPAFYLWQVLASKCLDQAHQATLIHSVSSAFSQSVRISQSGV